MQGESTVEQTDVGSYFVANYPPFSAWKPEYVRDGHAALSERFGSNSSRMAESNGP